MAYWSRGILSRIDPSSRATMGCISGITSLIIQSSISALLSVGTGGSLAVCPLRAFFPIARSPYAELVDPLCNAGLRYRQPRVEHTGSGATPSAVVGEISDVGRSPYPAPVPDSLLRDSNVGYPIDIRKREVNDRLHRSLRSERGDCPCDLFVHDGPSRCVHVVLVQFRRSLT